MWDLIWLVPLFVFIGLAAARWPLGEPLHVARTTRDMDPPGGLDELGRSVDPAEWRRPTAYRGWSVRRGRWPEADWMAEHPNYDASWEGEEDGWIDNGLKADAPSYEALCEEIDIIEEGRGAATPPQSPESGHSLPVARATTPNCPLCEDKGAPGPAGCGGAMGCGKVAPPPSGVSPPQTAGEGE